MTSFFWPTQGETIGVYASFSVFPTTATNGALALDLSTDILYVWNGSAWVPIAGPSAVLSIGTIDSVAPSANGAVISSGALIMQSASVTVPGLVNTGTQTFAGNKTFNGTINLNTLTASQAVVTDASKNLVSLAYTALITPSTIVSRDANGNSAANNFISSTTTTSAAGGITVLTASSTRLQVLSGIGSQTYRLPDATTLLAGATYDFNANQTGTLTIIDNGSNTITTLSPGAAARISLLVNGFPNGVWDKHSLIPANSSWGTSGITLTGSLSATGSVSGSNLSGTNTGDVTLTAVGASPNANSASLSGQVLTLQPADGSNPGVVTAGIQTFGGAKTFSAKSTFTLGLDANSTNITSVATPVASTDAANKAYVDNIASGLIWLSPIADPDLVADNLTAPPGSPITSAAYLIGPAPTGAWAGLAGHAVWWNGASWVDILGRAVIIGDRFGVTFAHGSGSESGNMVGNHNKIAQLTNATPGSYAYTFTTPVNNNAVFVNGTGSDHFGNSFVYVSSTATWVNFSGPTAVVPGSALAFSGNTLNVLFDNSTIDVNGSNQLEVKALGITNAQVSASAAIVDTKLATISTAGKVANSATTATSANTASAIVSRDGVGGFSAGTIVAALTGTASGNTTIIPNNHAVVISSGSNTLNTAATSATAGVALVSTGSTTDPAFGTVVIAGGGTNQTAFTGKSGNIAGLIYFDGTSLANDSTVTDIGYDTVANRFKTIAADIANGVTSGVAGTSQGSYAISGLTSGTITIAAQSAAGTYNFNLPTTAGSAGQVLTSQGGGSTAMTWSSTSTGTVTSVSVVSANGFAGSVATASTTPAITLSTTINAPALAGNGTAISAATTTGSGSTVVLGTSPTFSTSLLLSGSSSGTITIQPQAAAGTYNFNLPTSAGTSGQPLLSGGGGATAMSFGTLSVAGGGTGLATLTAHNVMLGEGTSNIAFAAPTATTGVALVSNGSSSDPSFGAINIASSSAVTGNLSAANLGSQGTITTFTASGTFTTPSSSTTSTVYHYRMVGAGGGGGGANGAAAAAGGGGSGAYAEGTFTGVAASTGVTITFSGSQGGTAGSSSGGNGGAGGSVAIGAPVSVTCGGGGGGTGSTNASGATGVEGGAPGTVTGTPTINLAGGQGGRSMWTGSVGFGGKGADSYLGRGGFGGSFNVAQAGQNSTGFGSGGAGAILATTAGIAGTGGIVIIQQMTP